MTVRESHDIALMLQHKVRRPARAFPCRARLSQGWPSDTQAGIFCMASYCMHVGAGRPGNLGAVAQVEAFDEVERAFVHVDWAHREEPEHKARPPLSSQ